MTTEGMFAVAALITTLMTNAVLRNKSHFRAAITCCADALNEGEKTRLDHMSMNYPPSSPPKLLFF
eukprot:CAMPEP_0113725550 /NCGR_PEP_ID=MMETSP0038_2-20120614/39828_1 /TAXON_ID=2898 /ORGANISM="Cryptomonas paramecium" /LENGTH=65 /DNA_ID=CAMNT_0000655837 /DNA_START=37 /DNA_END=231 /DNA_ORIENTATION=+ /assembly_acc=CAM_ASM_000170